MHKIVYLAFSLMCACGSPTSGARVGQLSLSLSTQVGGATYRLTNAQFALTGPVDEQLSVDGAEPLEMTLPIGSYTLELLQDWVLSRVDAAGVTPVRATLESQNPALLVIGPGANTQVMLRFALADGMPVTMTTGTLSVGVRLDGQTADGGAAVADTCTHGLLVNEIDYEQSGADDAEFVEVLNVADCAAQLADVQLELVNGGDGKVYGHTALALAGESLAAGARLVVGKPGVLATLPGAVMRVALGSAGLQNGAPDAVRLVEGTRVLDAVSYEGSVAGAVEGTGTAADEGDGSLSRCPDAFDSQHNAVDFRLVPASPGAPNACP